MTVALTKAGYLNLIRDKENVEIEENLPYPLNIHSGLRNSIIKD